MSDQSQALNPPAGGEVDDGFDNAEDRAAFADMEKRTSGEPGGEMPPAIIPEPKPDAGAAAAAAAGAEEDDEDEDGEGDGAGGAPAQVVGADGKPAPATAGDAKPKRRVSARKYERSEAARLTAETEARTLRESQTRLDERMRIINEALTPPAAGAKTVAETAAEADPEPDAEKDIFAHNAWLKRQLTKVTERLDQNEQRGQTQTADQELANIYIEDSRAYAAKEPHFVDAYNHLMESRTAELAQYYFQKDLSPEAAEEATKAGQNPIELTAAETKQIRGVIAAEEKELVTKAVKAGQSPAARIFSLSRARGFRPQPKPAADLAAAAAAAGEKPAPKPAAAAGSLEQPPAAAAVPRVADEIARIKAGSEASKSLSSAGGAPPNALTADKLANMPEEEFNALVDRLTPAQEREFFGT